MNEYPNFECQKVKDVCKLIHSEEQGLPSKVSKKSMSKWVISLIGFAVSITIVIALAWGQLRTEVTKNTTHFGHIQKSLEELKASQITKGDIYKAIKRAINNE